MPLNSNKDISDSCHLSGKLTKDGYRKEKFHIKLLYQSKPIRIRAIETPHPCLLRVLNFFDNADARETTMGIEKC